MREVNYVIIRRAGMIPGDLEWWVVVPEGGPDVTRKVSRDQEDSGAPGSLEGMISFKLRCKERGMKTRRRGRKPEE